MYATPEDQAETPPQLDPLEGDDVGAVDDEELEVEGAAGDDDDDDEGGGDDEDEDPPEHALTVSCA